MTAKKFEVCPFCRTRGQRIVELTARCERAEAALAALLKLLGAALPEDDDA
jgi:hypothetical protein